MHTGHPILGRERDGSYVVCTKNSFEIEPRWFTASKLNLIIFLAHNSIILWVGLNFFWKYLKKNQEYKILFNILIKIGIMDQLLDF